MASAPRLLAFAGSLRRDSYNKKLVRIAVRGAEAAGAEVTLIDLRDYPLPIFDEDLERDSGMPENGEKLKNLFKQNDGFLISSPEYNSSITAVLKNTIDWVSRSSGGDVPVIAYKSKVAGLMSASPGGLGGLRGLVHLRAILGNIDVLVTPAQVAVSRAFEAFTPDGNLKDAKLQTAVEAIGASVAEVMRKLKG